MQRPCYLQQKPVELPLWPNGAPNNNELTNSGQNHNNEWVSDVTTPTLTVYPASHPNGMAIIMCPGGGYGGLAMKHEGHDMAPWFNTQGITYAVLKYRMPNGRHEVPLSDAEQAIRMVREHAAEWGVNPQRVASWALLPAAIWQLRLPHYTAVTKPVPTSRSCSIQ